MFIYEIIFNAFARYKKKRSPSKPMPSGEVAINYYTELNDIFIEWPWMITAFGNSEQADLVLNPLGLELKKYKLCFPAFSALRLFPYWRQEHVLSVCWGSHHCQTWVFQTLSWGWASSGPSFCTNFCSKHAPLSQRIQFEPDKWVLRSILNSHVK